MSNMICQDPIEKFFGQQRQRGGAHENPTVAEFIKNTQALHVINTTFDNIQGNNTKDLCLMKRILHVVCHRLNVAGSIKKSIYTIIEYNRNYIMFLPISMYSKRIQKRVNKMNDFSMIIVID